MVSLFSPCVTYLSLNFKPFKLSFINKFKVSLIFTQVFFHLFSPSFSMSHMNFLTFVPTPPHPPNSTTAPSFSVSIFHLKTPLFSTQFSHVFPQIFRIFLFFTHFPSMFHHFPQHFALDLPGSPSLPPLPFRETPRHRGPGDPRFGARQHEDPGADAGADAQQRELQCRETPRQLAVLDGTTW